MTIEYKAKCPYCPFFLIDDRPPEKIIQMIINHAKNVHKIDITYKSMTKKEVPI